MVINFFSEAEVISIVCVKQRIVYLVVVSHLGNFMLDLILFIGTLISDKELMMEGTALVVG